MRPEAGMAIALAAGVMLLAAALSRVSGLAQALDNLCRRTVEDSLCSYHFEGNGYLFPDRLSSFGVPGCAGGWLGGARGNCRTCAGDDFGGSDADVAIGAVAGADGMKRFAVLMLFSLLLLPWTACAENIDKGMEAAVDQLELGELDQLLDSLGNPLHRRDFGKRC